MPLPLNTPIKMLHYFSCEESRDSSEENMFSKYQMSVLHQLRTPAPFSKLARAKVFANILNLPRLPVPKLSQTIEKYIKSVAPFLNDTELKRTIGILKDFSTEDGVGTKLQRLLVKKAENSENWLAEWWLNAAYLEYRDPVVVYSSPGLVFPLEDFRNEGDRMKYSADLILAALDYKLTIDNDKLALDKMGKDLLDMNQYKKIFGTCRIPREKRDELEYHSDSRHIIIVKNNNFFKLDVLNENGELPSPSQLIDQLETILNESQVTGPAIGVLTSEHRDNWAEAYKELLRDPVNRRSVEEIQNSLFLVALDNPMPKMEDNGRSTAGKQFIHGGGSRANSANRWFDKTVQFVIGEDGTVGLTYEHSPSEGQPIAFMTDYLMEYIKGKKGRDLPDTKQNCLPEKLEFNVDSKIQSYINQANKNVDKLVDNLDMDCFQFTNFGKEFVKSQKLSPDSFIQIAMQYAFYRIHKVPGAHYESAATRKYIHGRTETIRSCSIESINFARTMLDGARSAQEKVKALKSAIDSHKRYTNEALNGFGVDRHFLGLKQTALENGIDLPDIYKDPSFTRSAHFRLSTSQVATKCDGFMCYGPAAVDGYACCYNPRPYDINFGIAAFVEHPDTSARRFREALESSLMDMHDVLALSQTAKL